MAISMVRKPSETPNITNIDDIIPFRYAYGNQNGYVIGRGAEVSHTVNGNQFTVNSGRLVIQGVESDIDANGITLTIDSVSETRYYVVYYEVNLATNTANIKLSDYDTAGYPTIDVGDDLTANSSGIARLPLYRFTATSGVISNIEKLVKLIKYVKDIEVENAKSVNGVELKKENNILKDGEEIISRTKLLFDSDTGVIKCTLDESIEDKTLEIYYGLPTGQTSIRFKVYSSAGSMIFYGIGYGGNSKLFLYHNLRATSSGNTVTNTNVIQIAMIGFDFETGEETIYDESIFKIYKVYEIIE